MEKQDKLVQSSIKTREVTYFLVTERDLNDLKNKGIIGDIFMLLTSIILGGLISILLVKMTGVGLDSKTIAIIDVLFYTFLIIGVIFFLFVLFYFYQSYSTIKQIMNSGTVQSFEASPDVANSNSDLEFGTNNILKAIYYTDNKSINVTNQIRSLFENKEEIVASNLIAGDPEYGVPKKLSVKFLLNGVVIDKEFKEGETIQIP